MAVIMSQEGPDRREFLKRLAGTAAYATPLFITAGARAETSAFERATQHLDKVRDLVERARRAASQEGSTEFVRAASMEIKKARTAAKRAEGQEAQQLQERIRNLSTELREVGGRDR
jgi:hypothetical protein